MNNTPETDELVRSLTYEQLASTEKCYSEMRTLARSLESERDELQSDLEFRRGLFQLQEQQLNDVRKERDDWKAELEEQARLLGMSAERECDLLGKLERERALADRLADALKFIKDECDWQAGGDHWHGSFGDNRIGPSCDAALTAWKEARSE